MMLVNIIGHQYMIPVVPMGTRIDVDPPDRCSRRDSDKRADHSPRLGLLAPRRVPHDPSEYVRQSQADDVIRYRSASDRCSRFPGEILS